MNRFLPTNTASISSASALSATSLGHSLSSNYLVLSTPPPSLPPSTPARNGAFYFSADASTAACYLFHPGRPISSSLIICSTCTPSAVASASHAACLRKCRNVILSLGPHFFPGTLNTDTTTIASASSRECSDTTSPASLRWPLPLAPVQGFFVPATAASCDGQCNDSWVVFRSMPFKNLITWNAMIAGFQKNAQWEKSLQLFVEMQRGSFGFDRSTLVSVIPSCSCLEHCQQLHSVIIKAFYDSEVVVATALVKAYSTLGGGADVSYRVFSGVREYDIVSWTAIMTSFAEKLPEEAIRLFCQLRHKDFRLDRYTFSIVLKAFAGLAIEGHCSAIQALIEKYGFGDSLVLSNALIHAYARCGSIVMAEHVFGRMVVRDVVSWNSMIKAYSSHGQGGKALSLFRCMTVPPDSATFSGLLTACSHCGLINEGRHLFKMMSEVYGITPQLDHYACMVDILGRAGNLQEAEALISSMPMEADSVVWSALLGACRKHKEVSIAEKAGQRLMELEPQSSFGYVMMSNIYYERGKLDDASFIRKEMEEYGVKKEPGFSWI